MVPSVGMEHTSRSGVLCTTTRPTYPFGICGRGNYMSHLVGKPTIWFPNRSDTNRPVQAQKQARSLKFRIKEEEQVYYPCSENKGADQLCGYREADLRLCFRLCRLLVFPQGSSIPQNHNNKILIYVQLHTKGSLFVNT